MINLNRTFGVVRLNCFRQLKRAACGRARLVALISFTGLAILIPSGAKGLEFTTSKELIKYVANKQLSDKEYNCHNEIIYRESRWNDKAIGNIGGTKQAYGLYQLKIASMRNAHVELQFWKYWQYVAYRYGLTALDEPNYCVALAHLKTKGWQ